MFSCATCPFSNLLYPRTCVCHVLLLVCRIYQWYRPLAFTLNPTYASLCKTFSGAFRRYVKHFFVITSKLSMYTHTVSYDLKSSDIFSWNIYGLLHNTIGSFWCSCVPQGRTTVYICFVAGDNYIWSYSILMSSYDSCVKPSSFRRISCTLGIGEYFLRILIFNLLKSDKNCTVLLFLVGWLWRLPIMIGTVLRGL